jgi:hypothetical protein
LRQILEEILKGHLTEHVAKAGVVLRGLGRLKGDVVVQGIGENHGFLGDVADFLLIARFIEFGQRDAVDEQLTTFSVRSKPRC